MAKKILMVTAVTALALGTGLTGIMAVPKYSGKEKMPCSTCHVSPSGGKELTPKGKEYAKNGHTFKGAAANAAAPKGAAAKPGAVKPSARR